MYESENHSIVCNSLWLQGLYSPWNSLGQNARVGSLPFLQGIFPTQGSNPGPPHCRWILYQLSLKGSPSIPACVAYLSSSISSQSRNGTRLSCTAGRFFTNWAIREAILLCTLCYAKSLQSCPTLCNPIDNSPPGSPVPGILQARTLEWVAISFSNAWKWKVKGKSLSHVRLLATP